MSLNKAVKYGKEHRKLYRGTKAFDFFAGIMEDAHIVGGIRIGR